MVVGLILIGSLNALGDSPSLQTGGAGEPPLEFEPGTIHLVDHKIGWARNARTVSVSNELLFVRPALLRTTDGGHSWRRTLSSGTHDLMADYVRDARTAWVVAVYNYEEFTSTVVVLRTRDGGQTWIKSDVPQSGPLAGAWLDFPSLTTGWLMLIPDHAMNSSPGCLYRTDSGGVSWRLINRVDQGDGDPDEMLAHEARESRSLSHLPYGGPVVFQNENMGWLWGAGTTTSQRYLSVTEDGGQTWRVLDFSVPSISAHERTRPLGLPRFFPRAGKAGILCGTIPSTDSASFRSLVYRTRDGGQSWQSTPPLIGLGVFDFISEKRGWLWSADSDGAGGLFRTDDSALSWKQVGSEGKLKELIRPNKRIAELDFVDRQFGWALAEDNYGRSQLLQTSDGGKNWDAIQPTLAP